MKKLIPFLLIVLCFSMNANADLQKTTFTVHQSFNQVNSRIQQHLERCISRPFTLFQNGRRIESTNLDNTTSIYHVEDYGMNGVDTLDDGAVVVSKAKNGTVVSVTNRVDFIGPNLDVLTPVKRWVSGDNRC